MEEEVSQQLWGSQEGAQGTAPGPGGLGGFSRAGYGGRNGRGYQVDETVPVRPGSGDHVGTQMEWYLQTGLWVWEGEGRGFSRKKTGATPWEQSQLARWHHLSPFCPPPPTMSVRVCALEFLKIILFPTALVSHVSAPSRLSPLACLAPNKLKNKTPPAIPV